MLDNMSIGGTSTASADKYQLQSGLKILDPTLIGCLYLRNSMLTADRQMSQSGGTFFVSLGPKALKAQPQFPANFD